MHNDSDDGSSRRPKACAPNVLVLNHDVHEVRSANGFAKLLTLVAESYKSLTLHESATQTTLSYRQRLTTAMVRLMLWVASVSVLPNLLTYLTVISFECFVRTTYNKPISVHGQYGSRLVGKIVL